MRSALRLLSLLIAGVLLPAAASAARPVIVVFDVEDKGTGLSPEIVDRLSDFLALRLGAAGSYQVVPRSQLKERLSQQRQASYKQCYDQSCQVDIGRELAAQKSLSTVIAKLGDQCMVTAVLYDLKRATSEGGAAAEGGCSEREIVESIKHIVARLVGEPAAAAVPAPPTPPAPTPPAPALADPTSMVSVDIDSSPRGAEVFVEAQARGNTPLRTLLPRGRPVKVLVERRGYEPTERIVETSDRARVFFQLELSAEGRLLSAQRSEWLVARPTLAVTPVGVGGGFGARLLSLKWQHVFWDLLDLGYCGGPPDTHVFYVLSTVGYPVYLGASSEHQLKLGLGVGGSGVSAKEDDFDQQTSPIARVDGSGFTIAPLLRYSYNPGGRLVLGASMRVVLPVSGAIESGLDHDSRYDYQLPFALLLELEIGLSSLL